MLLNKRAWKEKSRKIWQTNVRLGNVSVIVQYQGNFSLSLMMSSLGLSYSKHLFFINLEFLHQSTTGKKPSYQFKVFPAFDSLISQFCLGQCFKILDLFSVKPGVRSGVKITRVKITLSENLGWYFVRSVFLLSSILWQYKEVWGLPDIKWTAVTRAVISPWSWHPEFSDIG